MKRVPPEQLMERYTRLLSVRKVAQELGLSHSAVWKKIGPVLPVKASIRRNLAFKPHGVPVREWARLHNTSPATYYYWLRKVQEGSPTPTEQTD